VMAIVEGDATGADAQGEQASGGELGGEGSGADEPAATGDPAGAGGTRRRHGTDRTSGLQAAGTGAAGTGTPGPAAAPGAGPGSGSAGSAEMSPGLDPVAGVCEETGGDAPREEDGWEDGGEAAEGDDVGAAGWALGVVHQCELVALSVRVEDAVGEGAHEGALLLAPVAVADALYEGADLVGDSGAAGAATLHELAHVGLGDAHACGGFGAGETLEVAEGGGLALARVEAAGHPLEQLAKAHAVIELAGEVGLAGGDCFHLGGGVEILAASGERGEPTIAVVAPAGAELFDGAAVGDEHEPAGGVGNLLAVEGGGVEALPSLGVTGLQVTLVEAGGGGSEPLADAGEDACAQAVELLAQ
jgi:hypothetical protein